MKEEHFETHTSLYSMVWAWKCNIHANENYSRQTGDAISVSSREKLVPFGSFQGNFSGSEECFQLCIHLTSGFLTETVKVHPHGLWHQQD